MANSSSTPSPRRLTPRSSSGILVSPALQSSPSISNFKASARPSGSHPRASGQDIESSASSMINFDATDGILIQDMDAEVITVDSDDTTAIGHMDSAGDEESRRTLRASLRKTLSNRSLRLDRIKSLKGKDPDISNSPPSVGNFLSLAPREYFVLTDAGKPVFISRPGGEESNQLSSTMGIIQALVSVFFDEKDKLRSIDAGHTRITFLLRPPLYYVCVSSWGEPESVTRYHLEYLHLQILSVVTADQLRKIFERRTNFDLRRLLQGAENFLYSLIDRMELDLAMATSSLHCLQLDPVVRSRAADALAPITKMKDVLYIILTARGRVITLIRPKKHSIHPADIHILLNTIHAPSIYNSPASASWIPVCLPKFNPAGFVNAYVSFLQRGDAEDVNDVTSSQDPSQNVPDDGSTSHHDSSAAEVTQPLPKSAYSSFSPDSGISLVCISGGGEFETVRGWCDKVTEKLHNDDILSNILRDMRSGLTEYSVSELRIPGLQHFVYKSRPHVQITAPVFDAPYEELNDRRRIVTLYQILHDAIHAKSGQEGMLKLQYMRTDKESVIGWITQPYELYLALSPHLPKNAAIGAANAVVHWVRKEESRLFLRDAPVF